MTNKIIKYKDVEYKVYITKRPELSSEVEHPDYEDAVYQITMDRQSEVPNIYAISTIMSSSVLAYKHKQKDKLYLVEGIHAFRLMPEAAIFEFLHEEILRMENRG